VKTALKNSFLTVSNSMMPVLSALYKAKTKIISDKKVPILLYHKIAKLPEPRDDLWNVPPELFRKHMDYIAKKGFNVISLHQVMSCIKEGQEFPEKSLVITFDDGYESIYRNAYPLFKKYKFPAAIFLACDSIDSWRTFYRDEALLKKRPEIADEVKFLSWEQIREMHESGLITIGSHTMSHPRLGTLPKEQIEYEVGQSKRVIEEKLNDKISFFAYPFGLKHYGDISNKTTEVLRKKGYVLACTSELGRNTHNEDLMMLKRIGMTCYDTLSVFNAKLIGAYDFMVYAQKAFQYIGRNTHTKKS
jgi:peptidoglycan/xylan/chitin deacetylase (PgdA/CDA1 family)